MKPDRRALLEGEVKVLNQGRFANPTVRLCLVSGQHWVVKDLAPKPWLVRLLFARTIMGRELRMMQRMDGIEGMPRSAYRVDRDAIAYHYLPGETLATIQPGECPEEYFPALEELVRKMHARGVVHLDLRYVRNVLIRDDGTPAIIDFQAALMPPRPLAGFLQRVDLSAVYKHWLRRAPESLDEERRARLDAQNRWRKYWFISGYLGRRGRERKRMKKEQSRENPTA